MLGVVFFLQNNFEILPSYFRQDFLYHPEEIVFLFSKKKDNSSMTIFLLKNGGLKITSLVNLG